MNKRLLVYETLLNALRNDKTTSESEDDKTFRRNTTEQIVNRDTQYTELLSHFVKITKIRNSLKEFFKWTFYLMIVGAIVALIAIVYQLYIVTASIEQIVESVPLLITAMVGFVSTIITIPVTITKYLFSTEEDKNITEIILHTQEHDTSGRQWATDFKKILEKTVEAENSHSGEQSA